MSPTATAVRREATDTYASVMLKRRQRASLRSRMGRKDASGQWLAAQGQSQTQRVIDVIAVALGFAAGAWVIRPVYASWHYDIAIGLALACGIALAVWGGARRPGRPWWAVAAATIAVYLITVIPVAIPAGLTALPRNLGWALREAVTAPATGWREIVTLTPPLGAFGSVLAPLYAATLVLGVIAFSIVLRRQRLAGFAAVFTGAFLVLGIAIGPAEVAATVTVAGYELVQLEHLIVGLAWLAVTVTWLVLRDRSAGNRVRKVRSGGAETGRSGALGRAGRAIAVIILAVGVGVVAAPAIAGGDREVLRTYAVADVVSPAVPNPLSHFRASFTDDAFTETIAVVEGAQPGEVLRIAALPYYDSVQYLAGPPDGDATFEQLAWQVPGVTAATHAVDITVGDYASQWLPTLGTVQKVSFSGDLTRELGSALYVDPATSSVLAVLTRDDGSDGLLPGDTYTVTYADPVEPGDSAGAAFTTSQLDDDTVPNLVAWLKTVDAPGPGAATVGTIRELAAQLQERTYLSHSVVAPDETTENWLTAVPGLSFHSSVAGHGIGRIDDGVFGAMIDPALAPKGDAKAATAGDQEQFAVATAMIAMSQGFPARVVIGATVPEDGKVRGADVIAWTEIQAADGTWASITVTPRTDNQFPDVITDPQPIERLTPVQRDDAQMSATPDQKPQSGGVTNDPGANAGADPGSSVGASLARLWQAAKIPVAGALALLLLALPFLAVIGAKAARRTVRKKRGAPDARVVGSWDDALDYAVDSGYRPVPGLTRQEIAEELQSQPAGVLAALADRAVFGEFEPTPGEVDHGWALANAFRTELNSDLSAGERLKARLSLRSLRVWNKGAAPSWQALREEDA